MLYQKHHTWLYLDFSTPDLLQVDVTVPYFDLNLQTQHYYFMVHEKAQY